MLTNNKPLHIALLVLVIVSVIFNLFFFFSEAMEDDQNEQGLFPGLNLDTSKEFDVDQQLWNSFLFVIESESAESGYELWAVDRNGCNSFTSFATTGVSTADFASYVNKPVLLGAYGVSDNLVTVYELRSDEFVREHLASYKEECGAAFDRF